MRRYEISKLMGALGFAAIFAGWIVLQWSSVPMRLAAAALMVVTLVVTGRTIIADRRRAAGRQVKVHDGQLTIVTPDQTATLALDDLARGRWSPRRGLELLDNSARTLVTVDRGLLDDEREARAFLGWLRSQTDLALRVKWTDENQDAPTDTDTGTQQHESQEAAR